MKYSKAVISLIGAIATWGVTAAEDNKYTQVELWGALLALATAAVVFLVPNVNGSPKDEKGYGLVEVCIAALLIVVIAILLLRNL